MTTNIVSNGSKWMGEAPDSIETLLGVLERNTLNRIFESNRCFWRTCRTTGITRFFGNFIDLSHGFLIDSDDERVVSAMKAAIRKNMLKPEYVAQPKAKK